MSAVAEIYASQPFWLWLALGVALLAVEAALSTEWLLWPAVSAGVVAVLSAVGLRLGLPLEIGVFAALTLVSTLMSRRLIQKVNPSDHPDINDRVERLVGQRARVVAPFERGRGRVFVSGAEWPAEADEASQPVGGDVVVEAVVGSCLKVRPA